jgi:hypothetical protein
MKPLREGMVEGWRSGGVGREDERSSVATIFGCGGGESVRVGTSDTPVCIIRRFERSSFLSNRTASVCCSKPRRESRIHHEISSSQSDMLLF